MKSKIIWVSSGAVICMMILINSCTYHSKEIQYPDNPGGSTCDTSTVAYSSSIIPIFSNYCYSCHSGTAVNGSGIKLDQYNIAKTYGLSGKLLKAVRHESGAVAMPKDAAKLSDCNIATIRIWIEAGAPNN